MRTTVLGTVLSTSVRYLFKSQLCKLNIVYPILKQKNQALKHSLTCQDHIVPKQKSWIYDPSAHFLLASWFGACSEIGSSGLVS